MQSRVLTSGQAVTNDTKERARQRAIQEGIEVRQIDGIELWTASSTSNPHRAYVLNIVAGEAVTCSCEAGAWGVFCKHKAAFELAQAAPESA